MGRDHQTPGAARATARGRVGVELDAGRATAVHVVDAVAVRWAQFDEATTEAAASAVAEWLPPGVPVTVALTSESPRLVTLKASAPALTRDALDAAVARDGDMAPVDGVARAALWHEPPHVGARHEGLVATWPAAPVGAVMRTFAQHTGTVDVVPSMWPAGQLGELTLALRQTSADLTWSIDGVPVWCAPLGAGGLDRVEARLGAGDSVGAQRVADALAHGGAHDRLAAIALDDWLRDVLTQTVEHLARWRDLGLRPPEEIYVHGTAATSVSLPFLLADFQLPRARSRAKVAGGLLDVPSQQRPTFAGAFAAGMFTAADHGPLAALQDSRTLQLRAAASARKTRRQHRRVAAIIVVAMATAAFAPPLLVDGYTAWAQNDATTQASRLQPALSADELNALVADYAAAKNGAFMGTDLVARNLLAGVHLTTLTVEPGAGGPELTLEAVVDNEALIAQQTATWRDVGVRVGEVTQSPQDGTTWSLVAHLQVTS